jgi:hypothetical protein
MVQFDNKAFTERIATLYAENLRHALPNAKFRLGEAEELTDLIKAGAWRIVRDFAPWEAKFPLDGYFRPDGTLREDLLAPSYADALSTPVVEAAAKATEPEPEAQLWILHKVIPRPFTQNAAIVDFVRVQETGVLGHSSFNPDTLKSIFLARAEWAIGVARI